MIHPVLEIHSIPRPRQRHHGGSTDGVGLLVANINGEWQGHRLDAGPDGLPVLRPLDRDRLCALLREVIDALDAAGRVN